MQKRLILACLSFLVVACTPATPQPNNGSVSSASSVSSMPDSYIGLSVEQAEAKAAIDGVPFRVVMRDGEALAVTMDYRPGRINATVENDVIVDIDIEGSDESSASINYDQNSWRTMIPPFCMSFFDGCNTCHRLIDSDEAACTKKFCQEYEQPQCLDGE